MLSKQNVLCLRTCFGLHIIFIEVYRSSQTSSDVARLYHSMTILSITCKFMFFLQLIAPLLLLLMEWLLNHTPVLLRAL